MGGSCYTKVFLGMEVISGVALRAWHAQCIAKMVTKWMYDRWVPSIEENAKAAPAEAATDGATDSYAPSLRDKHASMILGQEKGTKLFLDFGSDKSENNVAEELRLHFVGEAVVTATDGCRLRGAKMPAGHFTLDGVTYHLTIVPDIAFADARGAFVIPAWSIKTVLPSEKSEDNITMLLEVKEHAVEFDMADGSKIAVALKVSSLVCKKLGAVGVCELKRGLQNWEVAVPRKNPETATAAITKSIIAVKHIMA